MTSGAVVPWMTSGPSASIVGVLPRQVRVQESEGVGHGDIDIRVRRDGDHPVVGRSRRFGEGRRDVGATRAIDPGKKLVSLNDDSGALTALLVADASGTSG